MLARTCLRSVFWGSRAGSWTGPWTKTERRRTVQRISAVQVRCPRAPTGGLQGEPPSRLSTLGSSLPPRPTRLAWSWSTPRYFAPPTPHSLSPAHGSRSSAGSASRVCSQGSPRTSQLRPELRPAPMRKASIHIGSRLFVQVSRGGQGRGRTADLPLFSEHVGPARSWGWSACTRYAARVAHRFRGAFGEHRARPRRTLYSS